MAELQVGFELSGPGTVDAHFLEAIARKDSFNFGLLPILNRSNAEGRLHDSIGVALWSPLTEDELHIPAAENAHFVIGETASWTNLDSEDPNVRQRSEVLLRQQLLWASHIGLNAVMLHCPNSGPIVNFARHINYIVSSLHHVQILVRIRLDGSNPSNGWQRWNSLRALADHSSKLAVALELSENLPSDTLIKQWLSEPVNIIILPTSSFLANKKGYPVLSKRHQSVVRQFFELNVQVVLSSPSPESNVNGGIPAYKQYILHLFATRPELNEVDKFASGYHDYLQAPLQPLMDNLESATYEVFEKDPVKYREYENAIARALVDRTDDPNQEIVVMVVGAGRGPLVDCALKAAERSNRTIALFAVEKNPNAIVILRSKKAQYWGDRVEVIHADMRTWVAPCQADIMVFELKIIDNELSPECIDGAQKFLKADGISIPSSYTTFLSPISSSKLFNEASSFKDLAHMETPYVVKFRAVNFLSIPVSLWTFNHPQEIPEVATAGGSFNAHNTRYSTVKFAIEEETVLHGFAGYFETVLYKEVILSINPPTYSTGMFSWFPIYFPIKTPIYLTPGTELNVQFWRLTDARKVWYEWACVPKKGNLLEYGGSSGIHNVGGRSSWIGL